MMRSVINNGTAAAARSMGFTADAAGKTGTTNDLRDAWFVGFTPDLLCVVWIGFDDNTPTGLSGARAALPLWVEFMKGAQAGARGEKFVAPPTVVFVDIDKQTGLLATPGCPQVISGVVRRRHRAAGVLLAPRLPDHDAVPGADALAVALALAAGLDHPRGRRLDPLPA